MVIRLKKARVLPGVAPIAPLKRITACRSRRVVLGVVAVATRAVGDRLGLVARCLQKPAELAHRDFVLPQVKRLADVDGVRRAFVGQLGEALAL
jgi:hypothetical protein